MQGRQRWCAWRFDEPAMFGQGPLCRWASAEHAWQWLRLTQDMELCLPPCFATISREQPESCWSGRLAPQQSCLLVHPLRWDVLLPFSACVEQCAWWALLLRGLACSRVCHF